MLLRKDSFARDIDAFVDAYPLCEFDNMYRAFSFNSMPPPSTESFDWLVDSFESFDFPEVTESYVQNVFKGVQEELERNNGALCHKRSRKTSFFLDSCADAKQAMPKKLRACCSKTEQALLVGLVFTFFKFTGKFRFKEFWSELERIFLGMLDKLSLSVTRQTYNLERRYKAIKTQVKDGKICLRREFQRYVELNKLHSLLAHEDILALLKKYQKQKKTTKTPKDVEHQVSRSNSWDEIQEILLFGSIGEIAFSQGSLHKSSFTDCPWQQIKDTYDRNCLIYYETGMVDRPKRALKRHFKVMRTRLHEDVEHLFQLYQKYETLTKQN